MWKRDRDGGPEKSDGDEQKKEMEDNYRNTESRDREFNYKVFKIFRSFHCVSGATAFLLLVAFSQLCHYMFPDGDQMCFSSEQMIGMKHEHNNRYIKVSVLKED